MNWVYALKLGHSEYLGHTWSLAAEGQYYIIWPFVLIGLHRMRLSSKQQACLFGAAAVAVMIYRYASGMSPMRVYRGLDTHCDGLLIGSAIAMWLLGGHRVSRPLQVALKAAAPFAMVALLILPAYFSWAMQFTVDYGYSLVGILSGVVILDLMHHRQSALSNVLSIAPLTCVGRISYGLYLYHWPILVWLRDRPSPGSVWATFATCMVVTFIIADLSFRFIERPILGLKDRYFAS